MNYLRHISYATIVALAAVTAANGMDALGDLRTAFTNQYNKDENKVLWKAAQEYYHSKRKTHDAAHAQALADAVIVLNHNAFTTDLSEKNRDELLLAAVYDQNIDGIAELTRRHGGVVSIDAIRGFEAQFANEKDEVAAIAKAVSLMKPGRFRNASTSEVAHGGLLLAGCIKKALTDGSCEQAVTLFIEQFNRIMLQYQEDNDTIVEKLTNTNPWFSSAETDITAYVEELGQEVHGQLLRSARIVARALAAKQAAYGAADVTALDLDTLKAHSQKIKGLTSALIGSKGEEVFGNTSWFAWHTKASANPFADVVVALEAVTAEGDKIANLKVIRAQAEALNQIVQKPGYNADDQRQNLVAAVTLISEKINVILPTNAKFLSYAVLKQRAIEIRASISAIRNEIVSERITQLLGDSFNTQGFQVRLEEMYGWAHTRAEQA